MCVCVSDCVCLVEQGHILEAIASGEDLAASRLPETMSYALRDCPFHISHTAPPENATRAVHGALEAPTHLSAALAVSVEGGIEEFVTPPHAEGCESSQGDREEGKSARMVLRYSTYRHMTYRTYVAYRHMAYMAYRHMTYRTYVAYRHMTYRRMCRKRRIELQTQNDWMSLHETVAPELMPKSSTLGCA